MLARSDDFVPAAGSAVPCMPLFACRKWPPRVSNSFRGSYAAEEAAALIEWGDSNARVIDRLRGEVSKAAWGAPTPRRKPPLVTDAPPAMCAAESTPRASEPAVPVMRPTAVGGDGVVGALAQAQAAMV